MDKSSIKEMIDGGESQTVEFKVGDRLDSRSLSHTVCAFANSRGGYIIYGINIDGEIRGCSPNFLEQSHSIEVICSMKVNPSVPVIQNRYSFGDKVIVVVCVPKSKFTHACDGGALFRIHGINVTAEVARAYQKIDESGSFNFLAHANASQIDSWSASIFILERFREWIEQNKGWDTILCLPSQKREKHVQRLIQLKGIDYCRDNNIDISLEANEGPGPSDLKLSRGNDKTVIEIKLSSSKQYLHGFEKQIEEYAAAEGTRKRIYVYIKVENHPIRDKKIVKSYQNKKRDGQNPPHLFIIDSRKRDSASIA